MATDSQITSEIHPAPRRDPLLAPWWHTALLVALIVGVSVLSSVQAKATSLAQQHLKHYVFTMAWEIALAALAWWGVWSSMEANPKYSPGPGW